MVGLLFNLVKGVKVLEPFLTPPGSRQQEFPFETWLQTEILSKEFWGGGWGSEFDPRFPKIQRA